MEEAVKRVPASAGEGAVATAGAGVERSAASGTAEEAVAATREAARLTRILPTVGTLEPGKAADLIAVDGSPLDDISRLRTGVRMVVQGGQVRRDDLGMARG